MRGLYASESSHLLPLPFELHASHACACARDFDLLDLKLLPAWVEPAEPASYADTEDDRTAIASNHGIVAVGRGTSESVIGKVERPFAKRGHGEHDRGRPKRDGNRLRRTTSRRRPASPRSTRRPPPPTCNSFPSLRPGIRKCIRPDQSGSVAYRCLHWRVCFWKTSGYEVCITAKAESPVYQLR
jgi:hypothetical protein